MSLPAYVEQGRGGDTLVFLHGVGMGGEGIPDLLFMVFQLVIVLTGACLFLGQYQVALVTLAVFGVCLFIIASIAKSL